MDPTKHITQPTPPPPNQVQHPTELFSGPLHLEEIPPKGQSEKCTIEKLNNNGNRKLWAIRSFLTLSLSLSLSRSHFSSYPHEIENCCHSKWSIKMVCNVPLKTKQKPFTLARLVLGFSSFRVAEIYIRILYICMSLNCNQAKFISTKSSKSTKLIKKTEKNTATERKREEEKDNSTSDGRG